MAKTTIDTWNPEFPELSPIYAPLQSTARCYSQFSNWPELGQLAQQFKACNHQLTPVAQDGKPEKFEDHYEPRIYLKHELQTRTQNWHDFFNAMVWLNFNKTKSILNELHYFSALERQPGSNRSTLENAITLFDECGIIIISNDEDLLSMIRHHQWKKLFYHHRQDFGKNIFCFV
ncbi:MAG: DUF3025 domain-containing protein, partial [Gammaproteobacteria bacterium]|nr:DUF3025 domain-containing protein [Gammaproteobacteria bacterium]